MLSVYLKRAPTNNIDVGYKTQKGSITKGTVELEISGHNVYFFLLRLAETIKCSLIKNVHLWTGQLY